MTRMPGLVLLVLISCYLVSVPVWAQNQTGAESQRSQEVRPQPGATQAGPTSDLALAPKFNPDYFVGEWTFDGALAESPLGEGGPRSGTEERPAARRNSCRPRSLRRRAADRAERWHMGGA